MVCWEVLDADCDEETRQAGDLGSLTSLYEVVKLAYLQPDEKVVVKMFLFLFPSLLCFSSFLHVSLPFSSPLLSPFIFSYPCLLPSLFFPQF